MQWKEKEKKGKDCGESNILTTIVLGHLHHPYLHNGEEKYER